MNNINPLLVDTGRGFSINYLGKSLYSKYQPSRNSIKIANNTKLSDETLYIIPSPLLLYGIKELTDKLPKSSYLLGIEIDQKLMKLSISFISNIAEDRFKIVRLDSREQLKIVIEDLGTWRFRRSEIITLNYGYNLYKKEYDFLFNFSSQLLSTFWRNRLTINKLGKLWIKNILINADSFSNNLPENSGKPIIICGAGISLENSLNLIKKVRKKIYLMVVDTALSVLLESDIIPDSIFALESQFYNLGDFYDSKGLNIDFLSRKGN